ncbi:MAG: ATP-binding cassette domain-containing protein, partial [Candidatus Cloacimonadaceae bacterium]|nr:ATP-binding cassette domain-containing protein [Candidatus Cloacimonadaceae bacterium]
MSLIKVNNVSMEFAGNYVLRDIICSVEKNSRIGLIGANGSGKSTLLKIILGTLQPSEGTVATAKKCEVAYLPQNMQINPELIMIDFIRDSRQDIKKIWQEIDLLSTMINHDQDKAIEEKLAKAVTRFQALGGFEFENEVKYILGLLSFPENTWHKQIKDFSGGEQTRICLASILLKQYDLLVMDEPTNHLDVAMISWLEKYLAKLDKPYLIVSHDREFLDNTVSSIYYLEDGAMYITKGNYSSFASAREIALLSQERQYERQQKWLDETRDFIRRNIGSQKTIQARSRLKQIDRMDIIK